MVILVEKEDKFYLILYIWVYFLYFYYSGKKKKTLKIIGVMWLKN